MSSRQQNTQSRNLSEAENQNLLIAYSLKEKDPVMYEVLKQLCNVNYGGVNGGAELPTSIQYYYIDDYFLDVLNKISKATTKNNIDFEEDGKKLLVDTRLDEIHLEKIKLLSEIFDYYSNELNKEENIYIIHKFFIVDGIIMVVFDPIDTTRFKHNTPEQLKEILKVFQDEMYI